MEFSFALTEQDAADTMDLLSAGGSPLGKLRSTLVALLLLFGLEVSLRGWAAAADPRRWLFVLLVAGVSLAWQRQRGSAFVRFLARRNFRKTPALQEQREVSVSSAGLRLRTARSTTELGWERLGSWREGDSVLLLQLKPDTWLTFPRRAFSPEALTEFRDLVSRHLGPAS